MVDKVARANVERKYKFQLIKFFFFKIVVSYHSKSNDIEADCITLSFV